MALKRQLSSLFQILAILLYYASLGNAQSACDPKIQGPLVIRVRNITLQGGATRRGAAVTIGTPPQSFAFSAHATANNTYVFDQDGLCDANATPLQCEGRNGGAFDEGASNSYNVVDATTFDNVPDPTLNTTFDEFGSDTFYFNSSAQLEDLIFDIPRNRGLLRLNVLGLGPDSRLLTSLKNAGIIASKSWSIFWGQTGIDAAHQMDGNLVLGGYDAAKIQGNNYTAPIYYTPNCRSNLLVTVTDIEMNFRNGSTYSIMGSLQSSALQMCIVPDYELITIPEQQWDNFAAAAGGINTGRSYGLNLWGENYEAEDVYTGDLTFTFSDPSGLKITVPNHQLVQWDINVDTSGKTTFSSNSSVKEIMLNSLESVSLEAMPLLGMTFIQAAYLSVNHETHSFSLWQANATENQTLVGIGPDSLGCADISTPAPPSASTLPSTPSNGGGHVKNGISAGAIVGVAIGAVAGIACLALFGFWFLTRRLGSRAEICYQDGPVATTNSFQKPELSDINYGMSVLGSSEKDPRSTSTRPHGVSSKTSYNAIPQELHGQSYISH